MLEPGNEIVISVPILDSLFPSGRCSPYQARSYQVVDDNTTTGKLIS